MQTVADTSGAASVRPPMPVVLRSALFFVAFHAFLIGCMLVTLPTIPWPAAGRRIVRAWARGTLVLLRVVAGQRIEVIGHDNIPRGGAMLASKHQSAWETFALIPLLPHPAFVLKAELMRLPLWGAIARSQKMIAVDRSAGAAALITMARAAGEAVAGGAQLVIFPEGTRRLPGAPPDYKPGVALLYQRLGVPCVPVALNSGLFWPHGSYIRWPGTLTVSFLPAIGPGLDRSAFLSRLTDAIEGETDRLISEALMRHPRLPRPSAAPADPSAAARRGHRRRS